MFEFLGGTDPESVTAKYITAGDKRESRHRTPLIPARFDEFHGKGMDLSRSLWDSQSLIVHLDIEYVNSDHPGEAYRCPARMFELQEPVERAVDLVLRNHGIKALHLQSGRGHHYVWRIRFSCPAYRRLAALGRPAPTLERLYASPHRPFGEAVDPTLGRAYAGLALVMEWLGHEIKKIATRETTIPVELTAVEVGGGPNGREMISIDLSEYGDPLQTRVIRIPFSNYLKPWQQRESVGTELVAHLPPVLLIPLGRMGWKEGLEYMHDPGMALDLARRIHVKIPRASHGMEQLIRSYEASSLAKFHSFFYSQEPEPPAKWPETYDQMAHELLPQCARFILAHPNDLLLKPSGMNRIVRVFLALGWHPRHIAGLITSIFARDHGWGDQWKGYDPETRAEFYTRLFSGLFATGVDDLIDFNCKSAQEEKFCFVRGCTDNLERYKESLLNRRKYERLASRPINGLLLSNEHL